MRDAGSQPPARKEPTDRKAVGTMGSLARTAFNCGAAVPDANGYHLHYGCKIRNVEGGAIWVSRSNPTGFPHNSPPQNGIGVFLIPYPPSNSDPYKRDTKPPISPAKDGFKDFQTAERWANEYIKSNPFPA